MIIDTQTTFRTTSCEDSALDKTCEVIMEIIDYLKTHHMSAICEIGEDVMITVKELNRTVEIINLIQGTLVI